MKACGLFVLLAAGAAQATLLVQEGFNYPLVSPLDLTQTGGVGFAAGSYYSTNNANGSIVAGLSYPGLAVSGSNALKKASYGRVGHPGGRALSPGFGGSTFYMSLVINTAGQNDNRFGFEMNGGNGSCFGRVTGGWGLFSGGNGYGGISNTGGAYKVWCGVPQAPDSASHLVVYKFDYAANAIKLYVDPFLAVGEPASPSATLVTGGAWTVNFTGSQSWTSLSIFSESSNETLDELCIGTTWADVAPLSGASTTFDSWWTNVTAGVTGSSWGNSNNWANVGGANVLPGPGHANLTLPGPSYTALYDGSYPAITNLTVQNTSTSTATLLVSAPLTNLGGAAIQVGSGGNITVTSGGVWTYAGTNRITTSMLNILNGGVVSVSGGAIEFTNLPTASTSYGNNINVGYQTAGTLNLSSGQLNYYELFPRAVTNDYRTIYVGYGVGGNGAMNISGGTMTVGKNNGSMNGEPLQVGVGAGAPIGGMTGTVVVSGGSLLYTNANALMVGGNYGVGLFVVTNTGFVGGGGLNRVVIGHVPYGHGTLRVDGGSFNVVDGVTVGLADSSLGTFAPPVWVTGVVAVTSGTFNPGHGLIIGSGTAGTAPGVGMCNVYGGQLLENYYGVQIGYGQGGFGIGYLTMTNGLMNITGPGIPGGGATRWDVAGLVIGNVWYTDATAASRGLGYATISGSAVITNAGALAIGVNSSTGTITQTGGTIRHAPNGGSSAFLTLIGYGDCTVPAAHGGGNGTYAMSGGSYYTPNQAFVGGVPTNIHFWSVSGGVGLLKVSGGSFTVTNNTLMVGGNGTGILSIGSNGVCFAKDIVLTNNTQSTLRCELGTTGLGALTASGTLSIYPGAKLEVDSRAYRGGAVWIKLADCATRTGSFAPANITVTGQGVVRQDRDEDLWLYIPRGLFIGIL